MKKLLVPLSAIFIATLMFIVPMGYDISFSGISSMFIGPNAGFSFHRVLADGFWTPWEWAGDTFLAALVSLWKLLIYELTQVIAAFAGWLLDFFLKHSITSSSYRTGIIESGWEIIRNLVNIAFIFALMVIAFEKVFGNTKSNANKRLIKTIVIALVINFSLYATYLVIDSSNILANLFYNRIVVESKVTSPDEQMNFISQIFADKKVASVSVAVISIFNPQKIVANHGYIGKSDGNLETFIIYTIAGILNIVLIVVFMSVAMLFIGRTVGLMILGILAPLAFVSMAVPQLENKKYIGFHPWFSDVLGLSFLAPVFLFFMYLVVVFASSKSFIGSVALDTTSYSSMTNILSVVLPFALIATLLLVSKKIASSLAGELGSTISSFATKALLGTAAVGAVGATAAFSAAGGGMRLLGKIKPDSTLSKIASGTGKLMQTAKFDLSKIPGFSEQFGKGRVQSVFTRGMQTSYADADTAVRSAANRVRGGVNDLTTGRTPESVQQWQNNIQASRDRLTDRRLENAANQAERNATQNSGAEERIYDHTLRTETTQTVDNLPQRIEQMQAEMVTRSAADIEAEKNAIQTTVASFNDDIQIMRDSIRDREENRKQLLRQGNVRAANAVNVAIQNDRRRIKDLEKEIQKAERSTLERRVQHLQQQLEDRRHDARHNVFVNDMNSRYTSQDSNLTVNEEERRRRVQRQAARRGTRNTGTRPNA